MSANTRMVLIVGAGVILGIIILAGIYVMLNANSFMGSMVSGRFRSRMMESSNLPLGRFDSNGERIYFTGTSSSRDPIRAEMPGMHRMQGGGMACADCHGPDGRGGTFRMMMDSYHAPDIRYETLTAEQHEHKEGEREHEEHPPYTDETIKRAIAEGLDPAGEPLEFPMPRWQMSESDLNDLLDYLKKLK